MICRGPTPARSLTSRLGALLGAVNRGGRLLGGALLGGALLLGGCGGGGARVVADADADLVADPFAGVGRPTTQLYVVLSADPQAMDGEPAVAAMWQAVGGQGVTGAAVRRQVEWVPGDYRLNIDLDFADLPDPRVSAKAFEALAAQLPPAAAAQARAAKVAVFFRSDAGVLPGDDHIRLAGLAALYAAERWNGVVYDLIARRAWTAAELAAELSGPSLHREKQTRIQRRNDPRGGTWLLTRGEPKWGLPDLQVRGVAKGDEAKAEAWLVGVRTALRARDGAAPDDTLTVAGQPVKLHSCDAPDGLHDGACLQVLAP